MPKTKKGSAASAAQKAAHAAREAQKRAAADERAREEEERRTEEESDGDAMSEHEEGAAGRSGRGSHEEGGVKANCSFSAKNEERLVEFFSVNPAFYDKSHPNYQNQQEKDKLLEQLAKELHTTIKQIQGWFKHMRTSVGKLYKTKSGQPTQILTARKKWQLENFTFLKAHIVPRTYTVKTTLREETGEQRLNEESLHSIPTRPASVSPSTSAAGRKTKPPACKKSKIDLLMNFLDRPRPEVVLSKQFETIAAAPAPRQPDERTAFSQWIVARMSGIPHDRWDDFQLAAMRLMQDYSRPRPNTDLLIKAPDDDGW
ncbi:uncharacterized protein LOC129189507 [Dunckerocampus dactyliophorus]|uniref:uncharacterized protein LOC129189507 n=1 Tax=Dunckerocampus dactyliophorus TaxID=161453 RepID=UPI002405428A|nr:uncharacterized protein LOC129189507 [Dunckerocampus dactyliophorus]